MIYIVNQDSTTLYKIGRTKDIKKRIKQLQTGCPFEIILVYSLNIKDELKSKVEKTIHRRFKYCQSKGEWFDFVDISIDDVKKSIEKIYENIQLLNIEKNL